MTLKAIKFALGAALFLTPAFSEFEPAEAAVPNSSGSIEPAKGKEKTKDAPSALDITSEILEVDKKNRLVVFRGKVRAEQEELRILSDELRAFYDEKGKQIEKIIASGNVKISGEDVSAIAERAEFITPEGKIILSGKPEIWQGSDKLEGEEVTIFLGNKNIIVKKARATVSPQRLYPDREKK
jgi:lipopolysaccharide export system protein LptA